MSLVERIVARIKTDWWEVTHCGAIGYLLFAFDWIKYLIGVSTYKPDFFAYGEIDRDLNFDFNKDE